MSEENFKPGDKVLVNGGYVGEIAVYDPSTDVLVVVSRAGGSTDRATYHLSQTRLQHIVTDAVTSDARPEQPELPLEVPAPPKGAK